MARAFVLLFDSFGVGEAPDAAQFGDEGANTYGHIAKACFENEANQPGLRQGRLLTPFLTSLGLGNLANLAAGHLLPGVDTVDKPQGAYGYAAEQSFGKDTPSGHWEIAGVPVLFEWGYFPATYPSFPSALVDEFIKEGNLSGILGNKHASGTDILTELGDEHVRTGKPILYTSADSVFQIAAHEESFGLERLYELCEIARRLVDSYHIGRVIARPFSGQDGVYERTANRKDYAVPPPAPTLLNRLQDEGGEVIAIGKVADIYAHSGISREIKAAGNEALFDALLREAIVAQQKSLVFVNFVDFDSKYGHRRDVAGYAKALEDLDRRLPEFSALLQPDDIAIITADHGCDPTLPGSDHTREYIPILMFGPKVAPRFVGARASFADIGQTIASHLGMKPLEHGEAF